MRKLTILLFLALTIVTANIISCQKHDDVKNPDPPTGDGSSPYLPGTPYDYTGTGNNIPAYLLDYIRSNPGIDNTPSGNQITNAGATLGRVLFYDKNLSINNKIACASCHHQSHAFSDTTAFSIGFDGGLTKRNAMSLGYVRYFAAQKMFWDLRAANLETQTLIPILHPVEMGMASLTALEQKLSAISYYPNLFKSAFGTPEVTSDRISRALSQFVRSIVSFSSKYDQGLANNFANFTPSELSGKHLVLQLNCVECHSDLHHVSANENPSFLIVDNSGINTGVGANNGLDDTFTDLGIGAITNKASDMGDFKIPSLRNVELTAPYMHDGRFATLEDVIEHYATGVKANPNLGIQLLPGGFTFLTPQNKADLVAFLKTLTDQSLIKDPKYSDPFKK